MEVQGCERWDGIGIIKSDSKRRSYVHVLVKAHDVTLSSCIPPGRMLVVLRLVLCGRLLHVVVVDRFFALVLFLESANGLRDQALTLARIREAAEVLLDTIRQRRTCSRVAPVLLCLNADAVCRRRHRRGTFTP